MDAFKGAMMAWIIRLVAVLFGLFGLAILLLFGPGALDARYFNPAPPDPALEALFADPVEPVLTEEGLHGAEDLEPGPDGRLYTGLADGRIMARASEGGWEEVAHTGGRPLGLAFSPDGALHVADALRGLIRLDEGGWTVIDEPGEFPALVFTDDLTILEDGTIILTDASGRYGYGEYMESFWEGEQTARILAYTPDGTRRVLADDLAFANGVAHDPDSGDVFINETWARQVHVLDPVTGNLRILIDGLPGYPDNIHWDPEENLLWIAMPSRHSELMEFFHPRPLLKRLMRRFADVFGEPELPARPVMGLAVNRLGEPVRVLYGPTREGELGATTVVPWQGQIWTGGLDRPTVDAFPVPPRLDETAEE
ncbi:hypothetical protein GCM10007420_02870 [Glycocaulis albus]|jgi:sugar lactone lactonase YvrE|uniref:Strictosidine synthase conserved region domain-containing protein n=1 Tax=Glycocaulis albus TaxID=1382801 RepID=A0ABQ1XD80_9PROT|nr:SMP-30/gluconolactonase/LRE family protein [Glycocaulis albus]GGG91062.1 hypothetical protein GCM10007420_02870 [Glycocaulis albus]